MVLKHVFIAAVCLVLLGWSGVSVADEYRPDQFLGLDLSKALLSPKPLGPPAEFAPLPVQAKADRGNDRAQAQAQTPAPAQLQAESTAAPNVTQARIRPAHVPKLRVAHVRSEKPVGAARIRLAHRHGNPLDAQAFDTRIQVWPCRSGGICNWKR
jgi:hypothetical protein